jgi:hypothetical protein
MKSTRALAIATAAGLAATTATAQTDIFWNAGSGFWSNSANWDPMDVPNTATENAFILAPALSQINLDITAAIGTLDVGPQMTLVVDPARTLVMNGGITNNGLISLNPTTSSSNGVVQFNADATISGNGVLRLEGGGNDAQLTTNSTTVTNGPGHTIDGAGLITATLVNDGVVSAIDTTLGNRLELVLGTKTNNGNIQAGPGAELFMSGITITQSPGATISANSGGTVIFANSNTISGGRFVGPGDFLKPASGNLTLSGVSVEQDLDVAGSAGIVYGSDTFNCTATITLNDSSSSSNAFIQFNANTTVSGGGSFFLGGSGNDSQVITNGTTLTLAADFTVEGSGDVGATLVNNGLMRAFPSTNGDGRLRLITGSKTNNGQLLADTGGVLEINNVLVSQGAAGEILADGGGVEFLNSPTVNGGTFRTANGGTLTKTPSGNLSLSDISLQGDLDLRPAAGIVYNSPAFDCRGTIAINDSTSSSNSFIQFNASTTVSGGGTFFLGGSGDDSQLITNATTLTIAPDFTVEGSGNVTATIVNNGLMRAIPSANGDGRLRLVTGTKTNNALMRADAGGVLEVNSVVVNQGVGGELLADGGAVVFLNSPSVNGGTMRTANGGSLVKTPSGNLSLSGMFIDGDLVIEEAAGVVYNSGVLTTTGSVIVNNTTSASNSFIQFNDSTTVTGGGRIFLGGSGDDSRVITNATVLTVAPDFAIEGSGEVLATMVNNGLVRAFPSTNGNGRLRLITGNKTNNATIRAETDGVIEINGIAVDQGVGGEIVADGGVVEFVASQTVNGGTLRTDNGGRLRKPASGSLSIGGDITLEGDLELEGASALVVNSPVMTNNATLRINSNGSASNTIVQFNASTVIGGTGVVFLEGDSDDSQLITNATTVTYGPGQTVRGEGVMIGSHVVLGRVEPGLPVGAITGSASITFDAGAELVADVLGNGNGDSINVSGVVTPGGAVSVQIDPGYVPAIDDEFTLITAGAVSGEFAGVAVTSGVLPPDVAVRLDHQANQVDVNFVCLADLLAPFGVLDLIDINAFVQAFLNRQPAADLAAPIGVWDLADIGTFIDAFNTTCQ